MKPILKLPLLRKFTYEEWHSMVLGSSIGSLAAHLMALSTLYYLAFSAVLLAVVLFGFPPAKTKGLRTIRNEVWYFLSVYCLVSQLPLLPQVFFG